MSLLNIFRTEALPHEAALPTNHPELTAVWHSDYGDGVEAKARTNDNAEPGIAICKFDEDGTLLHHLDYEQTDKRVVTYQLWFFKVTVRVVVDAGGISLEIKHADEGERKGRIISLIKRPWRML